MPCAHNQSDPVDRRARDAIFKVLFHKHLSQQQLTDRIMTALAGNGIGFVEAGLNVSKDRRIDRLG